MTVLVEPWTIPWLRETRSPARPRIPGAPERIRTVRGILSGRHVGRDSHVRGGRTRRVQIASATVDRSSRFFSTGRSRPWIAIPRTGAVVRMQRPGQTPGDQPFPARNGHHAGKARPYFLRAESASTWPSRLSDKRPPSSWRPPGNTVAQSRLG